MHDESKYPTMKYLKCKKCGHVFAGSLTGSTDCPECDSEETKQYHPNNDDSHSDNADLPK